MHVIYECPWIVNLMFWKTHICSFHVVVSEQLFFFFLQAGKRFLSLTMYVTNWGCTSIAYSQFSIFIWKVDEAGILPWYASHSTCCLILDYLLLDDYFSRVIITPEKMLLTAGEEALGRELFLYKDHREISIMRLQLFQQVLHKILQQSL